MEHIKESQFHDASAEGEIRQSCFSLKIERATWGETVFFGYRTAAISSRAAIEFHSHILIYQRERNSRGMGNSNVFLTTFPPTLCSDGWTRTLACN